MSADSALTPIACDVDSLDEGRFSFLEARTTGWDQRVTSIDSRSPASPDARGQDSIYEHNTTANMRWSWGGRGILRTEVVTRAIRSTWHSITWRVVNRPKSTAIPFLLAWSAMPTIDVAVIESKRRLQRSARLRLPRPHRPD